LAALRTLDATVDAARVAAAAFAEGLSSVRGREGVGDVRQRGLLIGIDFVSDPSTRAPDPNRAARVLGALRRRGVLAIPGGRGGNVITLLPSRRIALRQIEAAVTALDKAIEGTR
jgi:4-aminobutyrate aminotransferase